MTVTCSLAITYCYHRLRGNSRLDTTTLSLKDDTYLFLLGATCTLNYAKLPYIYCVNPMTIIPVVWLKTTPHEWVKQQLMEEYKMKDLRCVKKRLGNEFDNTPTSTRLPRSTHQHHCQ